MFISSDGIANRIIVNRGCSLYIASGGSALNVTWTPFDGDVNAADGAYVTYASTYSGCYCSNIITSFAMTMSGKTVSGGMYIFSGGIANNIMVNRGGWMYVSSGGVADNTTVDASGKISLFCGGIANNTIVNASGKMSLSSDGIAIGTTVNANGVLVINAGGTTSNTTINSGTIIISSGGVANNISQNSDGKINVSIHGNDTQTKVTGVNSNGYFWLSNGIADNFICNGSMTIAAGGTATATIVNSKGNLLVSSGGLASGTIVNATGTATIHSGAVIHNATVNSGGSFILNHGGCVIGLQLQTGAVFCTEIKGGASCVTMGSHASGSFTISQGVGSNLLIENGGMLSLEQGGSALYTTVKSGGTVVNNGVMKYLSAYSGAHISGSGLFYLTRSDFIASGVLAQKQDIQYASSLTFSGISGFTAAHNWHIAEKLQLKEATVARGGVLTLSSGASVTFLNNAGTVQVLNGANVRSVTNVSGAVCDVAGGLAAMFMNSAGAIEQVRNHGSALQTSNWGIQSVYSGGIANNTTVFKGGMQIVGSGGIAKSGSVSSGGLQNVSGGYASRTLIRPGGIQTVSAGGLVYSTTVSTGSQRIMNGGSAQETKVVRGSQYISSGGIAVDTQMSGVLLQHSKAITSDYQYSGDYVYWYESGGSRCMISSSWDASETETRYIYWYGYSGSQFVSAGGTASATQLSSGSIQTVFNGGTATETIVNASAFQYVLSGGIAKDVEVRSGGILTVEYDGYGENIDVDNGAIVGIHGVVKNLRMDKNASYYFDMGTAVFRGYLDCYLNPAELNTLMEILQYSSELEQLVLRITASDFGQDNYNLFSVDGFENLDYEFMLALPQNEYVVLNPGASYWYDGERYSIIYSSRDKQYSLNKTTAEAEHVLITSAGNIDLLETGTSLSWNKTSYQSYGIVHAVKETGNDQTVYLNRTISISGMLQEASALLFSTGKGTFQLGTNTFAVKVALKNSVEAKAYGVRGANRLLRRSGGSPALPANVTFDVNAAAVSGYALAAAFINESTSMTVTGQLNAPITVIATGRMAEAIGFYSGQTIAFSEMLDAAIKVQAEAEQQAWALGFSRLDATLMKLNLDVSGKSKTANANATGMVLSKSGDLQTGSIMKVNASAEKNAYAGGFVAAAVLSKEFAPGSIDTMAFTGTFLGNMTVTADGEKSLAVGIGSVDSPVSVSFAKGMTGSVVVSAKAQKAAEGYGLTGIASSAIGGTISVTAESATEQALAIGMTGQISTFSGNLQVSTIGVGFTEAYGFTDNPEKSSTGIDTISKTGKIMISASSGKKGTTPQGIVYAVGGEIYSAVAGILCATAQSANAQETYAIGAYASTITISGTLAANARTRAIALCATSDASSALNATVSGVLFAGYMSPETQSAAADNAALATKLAKVSSNITTLTSYANAGNLGSAYSVYAYDQDDVVTLTSGAWLFGDVELGEGNNSLTISVGAKVFGSLYSTNGTLSLNYLLDTAASDSAVITSQNTSILGSGDARIRVTVSSATASGRYVLLQGNELSQKLTSGFRITLYDSASNKEVNLSAQESYSLRGVTYTLSQDGDAITLNVTGADPVKPGATGAVRGDFDGNGVSDILFQNLSDSANPLGAWMNADKTQWNGALGPAPKSDWTVYGAYDFTGSGVCDIMFRSKRADTQYAVGYYEDGDVSKFRTMGWGVTAEWELADVGDFNGSGRADILWKNSTNGYLGLWMDGTDQWVALPASNLGEGQSIIGMGDVNGDGCDDILINSNGVLGAWDISGVINGTETTPVWSSFGINIGSEWDAFGCADFDGNGKADIVLWRDDDGYVGTYMNCNVNDFRGIYPGASKDEWGLPGFGDYNGDGCDDVLVRNLASGALGYWDGAADFKWNEIGSGVDSTWAVIA